MPPEDECCAPHKLKMMSYLVCHGFELSLSILSGLNNLVRLEELRGGAGLDCLAETS